jgi:hypothetical protein
MSGFASRITAASSKLWRPRHTTNCDSMKMARIRGTGEILRQAHRILRRARLAVLVPLETVGHRNLLPIHSAATLMARVASTGSFRVSDPE